MSWIPELARQIREPVRKAHRDGTHRTVAPDNTLERVRPHLAAAGITRIANVTGLDYLGIPVVMVTRPNARALAVSQGKGIDLDHAKASGVMESLEVYHAERVGLPLLLHSHEEMRRRHHVVEPSRLPSTPDSRYRPQLRLLWIEGYDLMAQRPVWLPYESVHVNYTLPLPDGAGCFASSSNGLASGNHLLEAVNAGLFEVVERDGDALWHQLTDDAFQDRRIDPATIDDPQCQGLLEAYARGRMAVEIWDTTSDIGLPAFRCHIYENDDNPNEPQGIFFGAGCHASRRVALSRALTEAAQSRLTYISGARDDIERKDYRRPGEETPSVRMQRHLKGRRPTRDFRAGALREAELLNDDLDWTLQRLEAAGLRQAIVVDLTIPEIGVPVVKVVVPGLEAAPDEPGYVPGRRAQAATGGVGRA